MVRLRVTLSLLRLSIQPRKSSFFCSVSLILIERRTGYAAATMPGQLTTLALTAEIPIPTIPTTFFPGATPASQLLSASASAKAKRDFQA